MIGTITRKELTEMTRDGRFRMSAVIVLALLFAALLTGWQQYREVSSEHAAAQRATRADWVSQGVKNPHSAAHYGVYALKPRPPLSLFDPGIDPFTGVAVYLEAHKENDFKYKPVQDANTLARFGHLTASMVLQILIPLLIVLMGFSAFAGEREQGTLRQVMALGVSARDLAIGKAAGLGAGLAMLLVPAAIAGSAILALTSSDLSDAVGRAAVMALAYLLYFVIVASITLAVSARASSTRVALIVLLGLWIGNSLIAPRAATDLARRIIPTPSSFQFARQMERDLQGDAAHRDTAEIRTKELQNALLHKYGVSDIRQLPVAFAGISLQANEEHGYKVFDRNYGRLWDEFEAQNRLEAKAGTVAPLLAVQSISMGLSGTDFAQHRNFAVAAENYRRTFIRAINDDITKNAVGKAAYIRGDDLWKSIPEFRYTSPGLEWVLSREWSSLLILAVWTAVAAIFAYLSVTRLRVD